MKSTQPVRVSTPIARLTPFWKFIATAYADPARNPHPSADNSRKSFVVSSFVVWAECSLLTICLLILCRCLIFWAFRLPQLETVAPGLWNGTIFEVREVLWSYGIALISAPVIWATARIADTDGTLSASIIGGMAAGVVACACHAIAGGIRGAAACVGIIAIALCTLAGSGFGRKMKQGILVCYVFYPLAFFFFAVLAFVVLASSLHQLSSVLVGGSKGALLLGVLVSLAFATSTTVLRGTYIRFGYGMGLSAAFGVAAIASGIAVWGTRDGLMFGIAFSLVFPICLFRAYDVVLHGVVKSLDRRGNLYPLHPAHWDSLCAIRFLGLDELLVKYYDLTTLKGGEEIQRLKQGTAQQIEAEQAEVRLLIRSVSHCSSLDELAGVEAALSRLPLSGNSDLDRVRLTFRDLTGMNRSVKRVLIQTDERLVRADDLVNYIRMLTFDRAPIFVRAALEEGRSTWLRLAEEQASTLHQSQRLESVFYYGGAAKRERVAFVPREQVIRELVKQIMAKPSPSGILLYGRKRMGKSTLIENLEPFLPDCILCAHISAQQPQALPSIEAFLGLICARLASTLNMPQEYGDRVTLSQFGDMMERSSRRLESKGEKLLFAIDELVVLDRKLAEGSFSVDLLDMLRNVMQSYPSIVWTFISSRRLRELQFPDWSSYFVELHTTEVCPLSLSETRQLLCDPRSTLRSQHQHSLLVRFEERLWGGEPGIERIHLESGGWPSVVQVIAKAAIELLREKSANELTRPLLTEALEHTVRSQTTLFDDIARPDRSDVRTWNYLKGFADAPLLPLPEEDVLERLRTRQLVHVTSDGVELRIPILSRWLGWQHSG